MEGNGGCGCPRPVSLAVSALTKTRPCLPEDLLRHGPRRFHTGSAERGTGHGLGLTIALGQAGLLGAELHLANAPDGGAVATVRLPH